MSLILAAAALLGALYAGAVLDRPPPPAGRRRAEAAILRDSGHRRIDHVMAGPLTIAWGSQLHVGEVEHIRMSGVPSDGRFGTSASAAVFTSVDLPFTPCWLGGARCAAALPPAGAEVRP
jgi:hypothetical protein